MRPDFGHRRRHLEREREIAALAGRQHGVVALAQLRALGLSDRTVRSRAAVRRLHAIHQGVYALGRPDLPPEGRWMAAVLACGAGALASHRTAAALHGLLGAAAGPVDVTIARRSGRRREGIRIHRSTCLTSADRCTSRGVPCTSLPRTLLDLAAIVPTGVLERACAQAGVLRLLDMAAVEEVLLRSPGRPGSRRLGVALAAWAQAGLPRSQLESRFLKLCRRAGLPLPEVNQRLAIPGEEVQVDFVWRHERLVVETDGFRVHGNPLAFQRDRRRDQLLEAAGWRAIRFTWHDVTKDARHVTDVLRKLLDRRA